MEVWEQEIHVSVAEKEWYRYAAIVEQILGVDLGRCGEAEDGYCLDSAYDAWKANISPYDYAAGKRKNYIK